MREVLRSHSWGDGSIEFRTLAEQLLPQDYIKVSYSNLFIGENSGELIFNVPETYVVGEWSIEDINKILIIDINTLKQKKQECKNMDSDECYNVRFSIRLKEYWGLSSFSKAHTFSALQVLPILQTSNHYALIVHKDAAQAFGY